MEMAARHRESAGRISFRGTIASLAIGGLCSSLIFVNVASGATRQKRVVVATTKNAQLGTILVSGKTLYTLKANKTPCSTECVKIWPELVLPKGVKKAKAGNGVKASKLGTIKRHGGVLQVTYAGKPLYFFSGDTASGQVNGNVTDAWGKWSDVVTAKPAASPAAATKTPPVSTPAPTVTSPPRTTTPTTTRTPTTPAPTTTPTSPPTTTPPTSPPTTTTTAPSGGGISF